jgi:hypothetical protein
MTGPRPAGRNWTRLEDRQLRELLDAGVAGPEIAQKLKRTPAAVYSRIHILRKKRPGEPQPTP